MTDNSSIQHRIIALFKHLHRKSSNHFIYDDPFHENYAYPLSSPFSNPTHYPAIHNLLPLHLNFSSFKKLNVFWILKITAVLSIQKMTDTSFGSIIEELTLNLPFSPWFILIRALLSFFAPIISFKTLFFILFFFLLLFDSLHFHFSFIWIFFKQLNLKLFLFLFYFIIYFYYLFMFFIFHFKF